MTWPERTFSDVGATRERVTSETALLSRLRWWMLPSCRTASSTGGHGPRILLLHSGLSLWVEWRRVIDALTPGFEVLATTLPGSVGAPPLGSGRMLAQHVDYAMALMDERGWDDDVLTVGSSFGGCAAIELLARERAREVIAFAPPWGAGPGLLFCAAGFAVDLNALRLDRPIWNASSRGHDSTASSCRGLRSRWQSTTPTCSPRWIPGRVSSLPSRSDAIAGLVLASAGFPVRRRATRGRTH